MSRSHPARLERVPAPDAGLADVGVAEVAALHAGPELGLISVGRNGAVERTLDRLARRRAARARHADAARTEAARHDALWVDAGRGLAAATVPVLPANVWADSPGRTGWRAAVKRGLDVTGAIVGLILAAPVLLVLALLITWTSPGPVVFAHTRLGRDGRPFRCYKLRTMHADAEACLAADPHLRASYCANGFKLPTDADRRVTPLGRVLRLSSLDELPQLWNVLRGDMALVGPRPIVQDELQHYSPRERRLLLSLRPGITGAWAVSGRNRLHYPARAHVEVEYVRGWTLAHDFGILGRTIGTVLGRRGAV